MGRRNPIQVIGEPVRSGVTWLCDELAREAPHDAVLGSNGYVVVSYLLSRSNAKGRAWETSAAQIAEQYGWGRNRDRATKALGRAVKDRRLIIREYVRDGRVVPRRCAYVVCAGGRRFTDEELVEWSVPIELPSKLHGQRAR